MPASVSRPLSSRHSIKRFPVSPLQANYPASYFPQQRTGFVPRQSLSWTGIVLFAVNLLVFLSAFEHYRIPIGGLLVHAYLLPLIPLTLFVLLNRIGDFPRLPLAGLLVFTAMFCFSTLQGPGAPQESVKMIAGTVTTIVTALLVRSERDFRLGVLGLMASVTALSVLAIAWKNDSFVGANPLDVGNENGFSLYTLPPLLLASSLLFEKKGGKYWVVLLPSILIVVVAMFSNANRSGWLGVILILLMQLCRPKTVRIIPWVVLLGLAGYWAVNTFADKELIKNRYDETLTDRSADSLRIQLLKAAFDVGLEYPLLGVSPQNVEFELAEKISWKTAIDAHNVFGYIMAGCGFVILGVFFVMGWLLWRRPPSERVSGISTWLIFSGSPHFRLLRMMLAMWVIRGIFSREILYTPGFCIGLGLTIGLCISQGMWKLPVPTRARVPRYVGPAPLRAY
jgi:hypothetical protein